MRRAVVTGTHLTWLEKETKTICQRLGHKLHKLALEQTNVPKAHHTFYPRIVNNTDINFSSKEIALLEKGPKYNLHHRNKNWLANLALEAETAISLYIQLTVTLQELGL